MHRPPLARGLAAGALALATACYSHLPVAPAQARPGAEVRVTLAAGGAADLTRFLGPRAEALEGTIVTGSDSAITVAVTTIRRTTGSEESWPGDQVVIPYGAVATVQTRRLARARSIALAAAIIAAGALIGAGIASGEDINRPGTTVPGGGRQ